MRPRAILLISLLAVPASAGHATGTSQTQKCPIPVVNVDPDRVTLAGPVSGPANGEYGFVVTVDESVGESSQLVAGVFVATSSDGTATSVAAPSGFSPASANLTLQAGHSYTIQWDSQTDFGAHHCSSVDPGESPFHVTV
jgi:hypothetical protein